MLTLQPPAMTKLKTEQVMPEQTTLQPSELPFLVCLATLQRGTKLPFQLSTIVSNTPMLVEPFIDLGATGLFINIEYIQSKNIQTWSLPRVIPVYTIDGTPNEEGHITDVIDLIFQYKNHSEWATSHITIIGWMTIILGHSWPMEHNPEIDWCTGDVCMTRYPASCRLKDKKEKDQQNHIWANKTTKHSEAQFNCWVHVEEFPESELGPTENKQLLGFAWLYPDEMNQGDQIFILLLGIQPEEIWALQSISQKLA